jgi:hypothetical protein
MGRAEKEKGKRGEREAAAELGTLLGVQAHGCANACLLETATRLEELVDDRRWIPVGERLPEDNVAVLCWVDGSGAEMCWKEKGAWYLSFAGYGVSDCTYTHWRPLPGGPEAA